MAKYLLEINYTLDGVKGLLSKGGSARQAAAQAAAESAGGNVESFHFAFGGTDAYVIADLPDNISSAALGLAVAAGGGPPPTRSCSSRLPRSATSSSTGSKACTAPVPCTFSS